MYSIQSSYLKYCGAEFDAFVLVRLRIHLSISSLPSSPDQTTSLSTSSHLRRNFLVFLYSMERSGLAVPQPSIHSAPNHEHADQEVLRLAYQLQRIDIEELKAKRKGKRREDELNDEEVRFLNEPDNSPSLIHSTFSLPFSFSQRSSIENHNLSLTGDLP